MTQFYTRKSSAIVGAKRAGLLTFSIEQEARGWFFKDTSIKTQAETLKAIAAKGAHKSVVAKPVNAVHTFLNANSNLGRKEAIAALVNQGVNYFTARTQYQTWFKGRVAA